LDRIANQDTRWNNYCNKILNRIRRENFEDFPTEEEINKLVRYTEKAFDNTPFMQHAMDKVFSIRREWKRKDNRRRRKELLERDIDNDREFEVTIDSMELDDRISKRIKDIVSKIAVDNNIKVADEVIIRMSREGSLIQFRGTE